MAHTPRMAVMDRLRKAAADPDGDGRRAALRVRTQEVMEAEAEAHVGAERSARTAERMGQRTG